MLQLLVAVAFSAVPLTLYLPPVRSLNLFVETVEKLLRYTRVYTGRVYIRIRHAWARVVASLFRVSIIIYLSVSLALGSLPVAAIQIGFGTTIARAPDSWQISPRVGGCFLCQKKGDS
ncbi:hypothetical protein MRB53_017596 [Persea americana]|uniref:Uncharacterized protein n=1 Tax=Persea americana TaxID=3435 RepID=A0ACC2M537_PERAE|nr:hypothetical protein MRB53_017596 [Persea americana]